MKDGNCRSFVVTKTLFEVHLLEVQCEIVEIACYESFENLLDRSQVIVLNLCTAKKGGSVEL